MFKSMRDYFRKMYSYINFQLALLDMKRAIRNKNGGINKIFRQLGYKYFSGVTGSCGLKYPPSPRKVDLPAGTYIKNSEGALERVPDHKK